ncbi:hypothetical protein F383_05330 [Gossypium arboreum]|uniref:Uncharacterized protein n=1 Tax=Gossypium arboreum TaxID=29729 RepID=A0A0B0PPW2_GOSAR|nr:hypothetical protein F383_05330 [Gossypium arboreum]
MVMLHDYVSPGVALRINHGTQVCPRPCGASQYVCPVFTRPVHTGV